MNEKEHLLMRKQKSSNGNTKTIKKAIDNNAPKNYLDYVDPNLHKDSKSLKSKLYEYLKDFSSSESCDYSSNKEDFYEDVKPNIKKSDQNTNEQKHIVQDNTGQHLQESECNKISYNYNFENIPANILTNFMAKNPTTILGNLRHSNKERFRRERIKNSCNIMRHLLPHETQQTVKLDMATVLELIVQYLSYIQRSIPSYILNAINESFTTALLNMRQEQRKIPQSYMPHNMGNPYTTNQNSAGNGVCMDGTEPPICVPQPQHVHLYNAMQYSSMAPSSDHPYEQDQNSFINSTMLINNQNQK
ncbi:hypothetical protein HZS_5583 [Henneguya salminicola]|nr:hypothetical protein HZS_5583 [Henneguya salminicola]